MYVVTPKTMTLLVFLAIAMTFGGILAGFGFALLNERPAIGPALPAPTRVTVPTPVPAIAEAIAAPTPSSVAPTAVELSTLQPEPPTVSETIVLTLETAQIDRRDGGVEIALRLVNDSSRALSFPFSPSHNLVVVDDRGNVYQVRWAEYDGEVRLASGAATRLVRAFFSGPIDQPGVQRLQIRARDVPGVSPTSWEIEVAS